MICPFDDDGTCPVDYKNCEIYLERVEELNDN